MIRTPRLDLVPATPGMIRADLEGRESLERRLAAHIPADWPPELFDRDTMEWTLARLEEDPARADWWLHYFRLRSSDRAPATAIGCGGYRGPPREGALEVAYSLLCSHRGRGFATEATGGMVGHAFATPGVDRVIAETLPELVPSIRVLERAGFRLAGEGSEAGLLRYELRKVDWRGVAQVADAPA
jgi:[ribosomal protein S5]-alanine N-acetyltransferase